MGLTLSQGFTIGLESVKGSVEPVVLDGRAPVGSNEILVGSTTMRRQGIEIGDQVEISGPNGSQTVVVVGRTVVPIVSTSSPDEGMVVPLDTFMALGGTGTVADVDVESVVLATAAPSDVEAVGREIEGDGAALDGPFRQASVTSLGEVRGIPFYVAGFTAFIGTLAVFHALFVTSRRRRGDLAVLRALGYRPRQAGGVINWQGFFLGLASFVIGCPLGIVAGRSAVDDDRHEHQCAGRSSTHRGCSSPDSAGWSSSPPRSSSPPAPPGRPVGGRRESICEPSDE